MLKGSKRKLTIVAFLTSWTEVLKLFKNNQKSHFYIVEVHANKLTLFACLYTENTGNTVVICSPNFAAWFVLAI